MQPMPTPPSRQPSRILPLLRRPHDHHRDLRARLHAHDIGRQLQSSRSGSTPHEHDHQIPTPQIRSFHVAGPRPADDEARPNAGRRISNRAPIVIVGSHRGEPKRPDQAHQRRRSPGSPQPLPAGAPSRGAQIPIVRAAPPLVSIPAVSFLGGFRTPASAVHARRPLTAGIRNPNKERNRSRGRALRARQWLGLM